MASSLSTNIKSISNALNDIDHYSLKDDDEFTTKYISNLTRGGNWDLNNFKTIINWLNIANLYILLLNNSIEYYTNLINHVTIWCLIISTLSSTISFSQFSISESEYPRTSFILKFIFSFTSVITTILSGYLKISKAKDNLDKAIEYQNRWMIFATEISSQLQLPINIRLNATKIIINSKDTFKHLFNTRIYFPENVKNKVSKLLENEAIRLHSFKTHVEKPIQTDKNNENEVSINVLDKKEKADIKYIYDSSRLNIYFIFKDLIYNEIKNFEQYLITNNANFKNKRLKFTMTPSRIVIAVFDKNDNSFNDVNNLSLLKSTYNKEPFINNPLTDFNSIRNNLNDITSETTKPKKRTRINNMYNISENDSNDFLNDTESENDNDTDIELDTLQSSRKINSKKDEHFILDNNNTTSLYNIIIDSPQNELQDVIEKYEETKSINNPVNKLINEIKKNENNISSDSNNSNSDS